MKIKNGKLRTACGRAIHIARADPALGHDLDLIHERIFSIARDGFLCAGPWRRNVSIQLLLTCL
jgi:hypothetical protein